MFILVLAPVLGWFLPSRWTLAAAAVLPVAEMWATSGLGSYDRDGYENWGLFALPFLCALSLLLAYISLRARRRRAARQDGIFTPLESEGGSR